MILERLLVIFLSDNGVEVDRKMSLVLEEVYQKI